jgi:hypothetical protein
MSTSLAISSVFLMTYSGFTALALAMDRHHRQMRPGWRLPGRATRTGLRLAGCALLLLSFWAGMQVWGVGGGAAAWFGVASATVGVLICLLPYYPHWVVPGAMASALAGLLLLTAGSWTVAPFSGIPG